MFDIHNIVRFTSLLLYVGMVASSISGFVQSGDSSADSYRVCLVTTSLVVLLQNLMYLAIELLRLYDKNNFVMRNLYFIRAILIIHTSILAMGLSDVGLGFGIFGILMFLVNILTGVFVEQNIVRIAPYMNVDRPNSEESDEQNH